MPSGDLHAAINRLVIGESGRRVQQILDSTAGTHGPSHRHDIEHTVNHVIQELAKTGKVRREDVEAAHLHIVVDRLWSGIWSNVRMESRYKEPLKQLASATLVAALNRRQHGKRGRRR